MGLKSKTTPSLQLKIHGMDCMDEVSALKREILPIVGEEESLSFDLLNSKMVIHQGKKSVSLESILSAVQRTGMRAEIWREASEVLRKDSIWQRYGRIISTVSSGIAILIGLGVHTFNSGGLLAAFGSEDIGRGHEVPIFARCFYLLATLFGSWFVVPKAYYSLKKIRPDMNLLMVIAVIGAIAIGEWFEAATVSFLFSLSLLLESWSVERARRAVQSLMELAPAIARIRTSDGEIKEIHPSKVQVGTCMLVRPGEKIPLDGRTLIGSSYVNQAPITGESISVLKEPGSEVFAGTVNGDGLLEVEVTKAASDTTLSRIIQLVSEAQASKGGAEQWVEKFAKLYTPAVMTLALLILVVPPMFFQGLWSEWLYRSLVLLVIACPCALVISTPVSIVASIACAARNGVLVKGGRYIEAPAHIRVMALDKTGTLTEGKPKVLEVLPLSAHTEPELLAIASAMESHSTHPLAKAILEYAKERNVKPLIAENYQILPGKGATATINGETYWLGSHRYLEEKGQETPEIHQKLEELAANGRTIVVLGNQNHLCGLIALADTIRTNAKEVISELRDEGILKIVMLTGDNRPTAESVAREIGIDEVRSELLPEDKLQSIENLQKQYGNVAMVGDGINDAPALGKSNLGIAMGAIGSDTALETADIALMADDLAKLPWLIRHSRRTLRIIRQNITVSLLVKGVFVFLTFAGHSSLWSAIAADMGASFAVVLNGLRLLSSPSKAQNKPST